MTKSREQAEKEVHTFKVEIRTVYEQPTYFSPKDELALLLLDTTLIVELCFFFFKPSFYHVKRSVST